MGRRPRTQADAATEAIRDLAHAVSDDSDSRYWLRLAQHYTDLAYARLPVAAEHHDAAKELIRLAAGSRSTAEWLIELAEVLDDRPDEAEAVLDEISQPRLSHLAHTRGYERDVSRPLVRELASRCALAAAHLDLITGT
jgi:hypothetical protein